MAQSKAQRRVMRNHARYRGRHEINVVPMIDMMIILVFFLIFTAVFTKTNILELNLPGADSAVPDLPETILSADLLVSMPKLKTHHWAGVTLSMKNMFGCIPGSIYGFPKNVLHWAGIPESIVDINSTLPVRRFAIVDAIVGMEGNGPIQGEPRHCGALVFGEDPVAVDATASRLMSIDPRRVTYLAEAGRFLGHVAEERIDQIGEPIDRLRQDFRVMPAFSALKRFA